MSPFVQGTLYGLGIAAAFAGGYAVREVPIKLVVGQPAVAAETRVTANSEPVSATALVEPPRFVELPAVDSSDPNFQAIKEHFAINPSVVDRSEPVPEVLRESLSEVGPMPRVVK